MFLIQLMLFCASLSLYAAEEMKQALQETESVLQGNQQQLQKNRYLLTGYSGQQIKIQCMDATEPIEYPVELVNKYSVTLKNILEDLGTEIPVPIENATTESFKCLMTFAKTLYAAKPQNELEDARQTFQTIKQSCTAVNALDLLLQANYLDLKADVYDKKYKQYIPIKSLIASLYTDSLHAKAPQILPAQTDNLPSFDELPLDLHPLVAGWLLHDLLAQQNPVAETKDFTFGDLRMDPIIANSGSHRTFACIWQQIGGKGWFRSDLLDSRYLLFNLNNDAIETESINPIIGDNVLCALSQDNRHLITIREGGANQSVCLLYTIPRRQKESKPQILHFPHNPRDIITVLFDDVHNVFKIIAGTTEVIADKNVQKRHFYCYTIDPRATQETNQESKPGTESWEINNAKYFASKMQWNCVNGTLVGTSSDYAFALIYENQLKIATLNKKSGKWSYKKDDGKEQEVPFDIIRVHEKVGFSVADIHENNFVIPILQSFIPYFKTTIAKKIDRAYKTIVGSPIKFDPHNLHINFIGKPLASSNPSVHQIGIYYPCDPKLIAAINALNKAALTNSPLLLYTAYFLHEFYNNPRKWYVTCKHLINPKHMYILPEVQKIYGLAVPTPTTTSQPYPYQQEYEKTTKQQYTPKPTSFWDAYKQGSLLLYTQQQLQSFYNRYKTPIWGGTAIVGTSAFAAWLSRKSNQLPAPVSNMRTHTP